MMDSRSRYLNSPRYAEARKASQQRARQRSRLSSRILDEGSVRFKVSSKFEGTALILFNNWKAALNDALVETAGYDLEYAERILGPTPHVFENRFENEWSPEDVAQEVIQAVDKEA